MRILLIEDDPDLVHSMVRILKLAGYTTEAASTMREARAKIDALNYDMVITDVMLPHLGGFDIIDTLKSRKETSNIPIIVISGMDKDILDTTITYADAVMAKPFTGEKLLATIRTLSS